jgi:thiol-disulfide isomerase/thioredoxin
MNEKGLVYKVLIIFLLAGCVNKAISTKEIIEKNQITLIFEGTPPASHSNVTGAIDASEVEFIDDNFIQYKFAPDPNKKFDTLIINTKRKYVEVRHNYKTLDKLYYLFQNGDTIIFRYHNNSPIATVINRITKQYDVNFDLFIKEKLFPNNYTAFVKFSQPMCFADYSKGYVGAMEKVFNQAVNRFPIEFMKENYLIDSLLLKNLISDNTSKFFKTRSLYQQKIIQLQECLGFYSIKPLLKELGPEDFKIRFRNDKELGWMNSGNILDVKNDSMLYVGYYRDVINWFNYQYLSRKVGRIKSEISINNIPTAGSNLPDYLSLADTINENKLLSTRAKDILLLDNIQSIIENCTIDQAKKAFRKFAYEVNDSALVDYIKHKYFFVDETYDLQLVSTDSKRLTLNELIEKNHGNVIYIDFWSSGCSPCIREIKFSERIKDLYKGKNLIQVNISIEPDQKRWLNACEKYNLKIESYFAKNKFTSKQLENLQINFVPHYLIYNKQGKLVNEFAPRPSDTKLINLLDDYLAEK